LSKNGGAILTIECVPCIELLAVFPRRSLKNSSEAGPQAFTVLRYGCTKW
jgi:hypothetical protein